MANLQRVVDILQDLYPLAYAEQWDHPGLIVGDVTHEIRSIMFAADPTMAVVDDAVSSNIDLLICHHPLFFRSVHEVSGLTFRGEIVRKLYQSGCALWVGHTNADAAYRGVGQAAADLFGIVDQHPIDPITDPASAHEVGIGRYGQLQEPCTLREFADRIVRVLPKTHYGIQVSGCLDAVVKRVAVLPGSGDSMFDAVNALDVDVYVTSDLRHHPATDQMQQTMYESMLQQRDNYNHPALINTPHSAIESLWFTYAQHDIPEAIERITGQRPTVTWNTRITDPWDLQLTSKDAL